jgi:hypothetical protein
MKWHAITDQDLRVVERVMKRLFTEDRMTADDMHDAAQELETFLRSARDMDVTSQLQDL